MSGGLWSRDAATADAQRHASIDLTDVQQLGLVARVAAVAAARPESGKVVCGHRMAGRSG